MNSQPEIAYYCFNGNCSVSVYNDDTVLSIILPLSAETLSLEPCCPLCGERLVSLIDLEIKTSVLAAAILVS